MRHSIPAVLALALVAGCANRPEQRQDPPASPMPGSDQLVQAAQLINCAAALQILVQGNATAKVEVMASARAKYEDSKAGPAALCYGLMLAAPEHQLREPLRAQHVLQEAMARSELLSASEKAWGEVELKRVGAELRLVAEIDRLVAELRLERDRTQAALANPALNKRLQAEIEESARLRKALDEAKAKLDAITRMERSFSDRPPASEGRNP